MARRNERHAYEHHVRTPRAGVGGCGVLIALVVGVVAFAGLAVMLFAGSAAPEEEAPPVPVAPAETRVHLAALRPDSGDYVQLFPADFGDPAHFDPVAALPAVGASARAFDADAILTMVFLTGVDRSGLVDLSGPFTAQYLYLSRSALQRDPDRGGRFVHIADGEVSTVRTSSTLTPDELAPADPAPCGLRALFDNLAAAGQLPAAGPYGVELTRDLARGVWVWTVTTDGWRSDPWSASTCRPG